MSDTPPLKINVYHASGLISEFVQYDQAAALEFLGQLQPRKIFTPRVLVLSGDFSVSNIVSHQVSRIDFLTQENVPCEFPDWISDLTVVPTHEEFLTATGLDRGEPARRSHSFFPGEEFEGHIACHLLGAEPVYARVRGTMSVAVELRSRLVHLFELPALQFKRPDGGITIVNPANLVRITMFPGPPGLGSDVWPVESITL
ncbi:MAG: hypothetical protein AB1705_15780 [Verrucomicrobiota bacterium]